MRQDFIVNEPPDGEGKLEVRLRVTTNLHIRVGAEALAFVNASSQKMMKYSKLKVWDADGKILNAFFEKRGKDEIAIVVNDENAIYPITIDPLSTSANWTAESNQASAYFGYSVSTAGDVNGDGYSDVIVGGWYYNNDQIIEGRAFVYHGSASGL